MEALYYHKQEWKPSWKALQTRKTFHRMHCILWPKLRYLYTINVYRKQAILTFLYFQEFFVEYLSQEIYRSSGKKSELTYSGLAEIVQTSDSMEFLKGINCSVQNYFCSTSVTVVFIFCLSRNGAQKNFLQRVSGSHEKRKRHWGLVLILKTIKHVILHLIDFHT